MPEQFLIDTALLQAVGNYLASRPYREVVELLNALQNLKRAGAPPEQEPM